MKTGKYVCELSGEGIRTQADALRMGGGEVREQRGIAGGDVKR